MSDTLSSIANAIPSLSDIYSGVPERLKQEAVAAKERLFSQKTPYESHKRAKLALPPGVDQPSYDKAITELKQALGKDNVELNDKPLVDGWYMQHPFVELLCSSGQIS